MSESYIEQKINSLTNKNLSYIQISIESDLEYYRGILYRIAADDAITDDEVKVKNGDDFTRESYGIKLRDLLASYADIRDEIVGITYISSSNQDVFYDKRNMSATNYIWDSYSSEEKEKIYNNVHNSNRVVFFNTKNHYYNNEKSCLYNVGIRVWNIKTGEDLGIILLSIDEQRLQNICNIQSDTATNNSVKEYSFIVDSKNEILSFSDKNYIGKKFDQTEHGIATLMQSVPFDLKNGVLVNSVSIPGANWKVINLVDKESMFYEINLLRKFTIIVTFLIVIFCSLFIILFTNKFYGSVKTIIEAIKRAKSGDFNAHLRLKGENELVFIGNEFNDMMLKIKGLVENLKQQNEYIFEISNRKREAEINAIVAQINPHFLYNTLDCINWIAIRDENFKISQMIGNLADILRYSIHGVNEQVTIYEMIEWLKKYLYLYSVRLNYSFQTVWNIDDNILSYKIYKLLVQPIVENAIVHGFKECDHKQTLLITIRKENEKSLQIKIEDNGVGIPEEKLAHLFDVTCKKKVGLFNVKERLKIYYKDAAQMHIDSKQQKGTKVTLKIPLVS
ncbi:sensor histidine kinase [uncultured Clostridium sp.]|uniref:sensor histidine kinase n=1 Tax=uncultured Clostridium sp. TaxID=59620 RepID=UPI0025CFA481|nr:sensor histidine kinase [uncultured Clostridium sp.]